MRETTNGLVERAVDGGIRILGAAIEVVGAFTDELSAHARHEGRVLYRWYDEHLSAADRASFLLDLTERRRR
jgi:hypothetical protein